MYLSDKDQKKAWKLILKKWDKFGLYKLPKKKKNATKNTRKAALKKKLKKKKKKQNREEKLDLVLHTPQDNEYRNSGVFEQHNIAIAEERNKRKQVLIDKENKKSPQQLFIDKIDFIKRPSFNIKKKKKKKPHDIRSETTPANIFFGLKGHYKNQSNGF